MHARVRFTLVTGSTTSAAAVCVALATSLARPALAGEKKVKEQTRESRTDKPAATQEHPTSDSKPLGDASRGKAVFTNFCSPCHGDKGDAKSPLADSLPIKPRDFLHEKLRWGNTRESIVETILEGRSDVMPSFRGAMPDEDVANVAAYVWSLMPEENRRVAPPPTEPAVKGKALVVGQKGKRFAPERVTMTAGETLLVVNNDDISHDVHAAVKKAGAEQFRTQKPGQWDRVAFKDKGVFEFRCSIHPNMKLTVEVK